MKVSLSLEILKDLGKKFRDDYDCEQCETMDKWMKAEDPIKRILCQHCLEYDPLIEQSPYCKNCIELLPKILILNDMTKITEGNGEGFYNLDKSTKEYKILKDHLPESEAEVDSFFYSIIPKERLPMEPLTLNALAKFCKIVFENEKYISFSKWCVESEKWEDNPNPHVHAVIKFRDSHNYARFMCTQWKKVFPLPEYTIQFSRYSKKLKRNVKGIDIYRCMNAEITSDKIKYLDNGNKDEIEIRSGDDHTNFIDLGINGGLSS